MLEDEARLIKQTQCFCNGLIVRKGKDGSADAEYMGYSVRDIIICAELLKRNRVSVEMLHSFADSFSLGYQEACREMRENQQQIIDNVLGKYV